MSNIISLEVVKNAAKDNTSASLSRHAIAELAKYIAALEAENAELKARLERVQRLYDQAAQTIRNQSETIRRNSGSARDFVGIY